jgi:hypothetical protein
LQAGTTISNPTPGLLPAGRPPLRFGLGSHPALIRPASFDDDSWTDSPVRDSRPNRIDPFGDDDFNRFDFSRFESTSGGGLLNSIRDFYSPDSDWSWQVAPTGLMYRSYVAGEKEPRLSAAILHESGAEWLTDYVLGGRVGLLRYGNRSASDPEGFQIDFEGAVFLRILPERDLQMLGNDFRYGVPLTFRRGRWQTKFGMYHVSSHFGDQWMLANPGFTYRHYVRDALIAGVGYFPTDHLRVYFEFGGAYNTKGGARPWEMQTGFEWGQQFATGPRGAPFLASNVHLMQEVGWGGPFSLVTGWHWRNEIGQTFRLGLQYYNGPTNQWSFLGQSTELVGATARFDF